MSLFPFHETKVGAIKSTKRYSFGIVSPQTRSRHLVCNSQTLSVYVPPVVWPGFACRVSKIDMVPSLNLGFSWSSRILEALLGRGSTPAGGCRRLADIWGIAGHSICLACWGGWRMLSSYVVNKDQMFFSSSMLATFWTLRLAMMHFQPV